MIRNSVFYNAALMAALLISSAAFAQTPPIEMGARVPADLQSPGFVYKGFVYAPSLTLNTVYDDNIYASGSAEQDDFVFTLVPKLSLRKEYDRLTINAQTRAEIDRYAENADEDKQSYFGAVNGEFSANSRWQFPFSFDYSNSFRDRSGSVGTLLTTDKPTGIDQFSGEAGVVHRFNRLSLGLIGEYSNITLEDGISDDGTATPVIYSDKDRDSLGGRIEARYDLLRGDTSGDSPEHALFATLGASKQYYDRLTYTGGSFSGLTNDQTITSGLAGFETTYKGLLTARLGVGFLHRLFEAPSLEETTDVDYEADVKYLVTPKMNLGFKVGREVDQDNDIQQGLLKTTYAFVPEYEIYHDLYLNGQLRYTTNEFVNETREDDDILMGLGLKYYINKNLESEIGIRHTTRDSTLDTADTERTIFLLGITGKL